MEQVITRNRNKRSSRKSTEMLILEMNRRKKACLVKLQKLSDRINILKDFQNQTLGKRLNLKEYLKAKGFNYKTFFAPMGYFSPNNMVVSDDAENDYLTYHKGMRFNRNVGYHIPERNVVKEQDHKEITSSIYGMTWNPALMQYFPTTVFDSTAYSNAQSIGDAGIDMIGGLRIEDFANLTNEDENAIELTSFVQGLFEEEFDNVEGELDIIEDAQMELYGDDLSFEGEDAYKIQSNNNFNRQTDCGTKYPFNKQKRGACIEKFENSDITDTFSNFLTRKEKRKLKKENRIKDRDDRKTARDKFRKGKKDCQAKLKSGELQKWQMQECIKSERKEKRSEIKDAGGNVFGRGLRTIAKVSPLTALSRGGVLVLVGDNTFGFATRLAPALLPDAEAKELFKPEAIVKAKKGWEKVKKAYRNLGGDNEKLRLKVIEGYKKKPYKVAKTKDSSFEGSTIYEFEERSNFAEPVSGTVIGLAVTTGLGTLTALINAFSKAGGEKNPYKDDKTPEDYKKGLEDGSVESNPSTETDAPVLNDKGEWTEPSTGKIIDPITGKYKDTIFGVNKWLVFSIGVAGVVGIYYIFKGKK